MIRILLVFIALAAGGAAGWLALTAQQPAGPAPVAQAPRIVEAPTVEVLVASADVGQGNPLSEANLQWQSWPQSGVSAKFVLRSAQPDAIQQMSGQIARREILAQEPVTPDKLTAPAANPLAAALANGKRAVAVRISAETTAGGFILPNDHVDVLHTSVVNGPGGERVATTTTILHNVLVLAIDQSFQSDSSGKTKGAAVGRTATLELTPEQSERLVAGESSGVISLVLRPVGDSAVPVARAQRPSPAAAPAPQQDTIRITRGTEVEIVRRPAPARAAAGATVQQ